MWGPKGLMRSMLKERTARSRTTMKSVGFGPSGSQNRVQRRTFVGRRFRPWASRPLDLTGLLWGGGHSGGQKRSTWANIAPRWTNIAPKTGPKGQHDAQDGPPKRPRMMGITPKMRRKVSVRVCGCVRWFDVPQRDVTRRDVTC